MSQKLKFAGTFFNMIFRNRSPKGIFGQNISDVPNGPLTGASRSYRSAILKQFFSVFMMFLSMELQSTE